MCRPSRLCVRMGCILLQPTVPSAIGSQRSGSRIKVKLLFYYFFLLNWPALWHRIICKRNMRHLLPSLLSSILFRMLQINSERWRQSLNSAWLTSVHPRNFPVINQGLPTRIRTLHYAKLKNKTKLNTINFHLIFCHCHQWWPWVISGCSIHVQQPEHTGR